MQQICNVVRAKVDNVSNIIYDTRMFNRHSMINHSRHLIYKWLHFVVFICRMYA